MANPPFNPSETDPTNNSVVANFPANERTFRDVIESWLLWEHDRSGYHAFDMDTTVNRDADATRPAGSLFFNTTLSVLQFCVDASPAIWDTLSFPPGTRLLFQNSTPPPGWTKVTDAAANESIVRVVTGTPGAGGGDIAFSTFFSAAYNNGVTADTAISIAQMPPHFFYTVYPVDAGSGAGLDANSSIASAGGGGSANERYGLRAAGALATIGPTNILGSGAGHNHTVVLDAAVKYLDYILCEKDAYA